VDAVRCSLRYWGHRGVLGHRPRSGVLLSVWSCLK
jgi:hypothetical protein